MRALAPLLVLGVLAVGCGANDPLAAEEVAEAAAKTADAGSSRFEISGEDGEATFTMTGKADYERRVASLEYRSAAKEAREGPDSDEGAIRVVDETMYWRSPMLIGTTGKWLSMSLGEDDEPSLDDLVFPFPLVDPAKLLDTFEQVGGAPKGLGEEDVRGVPTEGYLLALDFERLIERAPAAHRARLREELRKREEKTQPVEIWIDADGLARRVRLLDEAGDATVDFFDFGVPVEVEAPPAQDVMAWEDAFTMEGSSGTRTLSDDEEVDP